MQLTRLELQNFRVYAGRQSIHLTSPEGQRNVYLFGGLNGAGKTSLFSAVVLALYGRDSAGLAFQRALGDGLDQVYRRYLEESFSRRARSRGELEMSVQLTLESEALEYRITRTWWFDEGGQFEDEELRINAGAQPLLVEAESDDERREILQQFVERLAPARIAKFFFFDGEEIKGIATRDPGQAVVEGLNQLLGFHTLQRLSEDLDTLKRNIRRELPGASSSGLLQLHEEMDGLRVELERWEAEAADLRRKIDAKAERLREIDAEIEAMFGGQSIQSRSEALDALAAREREYARLSQEIQLFVADVLALTLPGGLLRAAVKRAKREAAERRVGEARRRLRGVRERLSHEVFDSADLSTEQREKMKQRFDEAWASHVEAAGRTGTTRFALLSTSELERLPETLRETTETARRELLARLARRDHIQQEMTRLKGVQTLFEAGPRAQEILESKMKILEERLSLEAQEEKLRRQLEVEASELAAKEATASRMEKQLVTTDEVRAELDVIQRVQAVLSRFMEELRRRRVKALANATNEMMRRLTHKEDLVSRIEIDPETFRTQLVDQSGEEVLNLSAGEREIFALSLVWGLASISKRNLPMIIDTPLGRLDQMHRANVVEQFLPRAAEQVVILATDSEIDGRWYSRLQDHLAQEAVIEYSRESASSTFASGRFLALESIEEGA